MTVVERDIGLALLKRLMQRGLISEETYISASHSKVFDFNHFSNYVVAEKDYFAREEQSDDRC